MSAYVVFTRTKTIDQKELETYWTGSQATMKGYPIEALVAYGNHEILEGDPIEGIVIAKFPKVKAAKEWYLIEAYQAPLSTANTGRSITDSLLKVSTKPGTVLAQPAFQESRSHGHRGS